MYSLQRDKSSIMDRRVLIGHMLPHSHFTDV